MAFALVVALGSVPRYCRSLQSVARRECGGRGVDMAGEGVGRHLKLEGGDEVTNALEEGFGLACATVEASGPWLAAEARTRRRRLRSRCRNKARVSEDDFTSGPGSGSSRRPAVALKCTGTPARISFGTKLMALSVSKLAASPDRARNRPSQSRPSHERCARVYQIVAGATRRPCRVLPCTPRGRAWFGRSDRAASRARSCRA